MIRYNRMLGYGLNISNIILFNTYFLFPALSPSSHIITTAQFSSCASLRDFENLHAAVDLFSLFSINISTSSWVLQCPLENTQLSVWGLGLLELYGTITIKTERAFSIILQASLAVATTSSGCRNFWQLSCIHFPEVISKCQTDKAFLSHPRSSRDLSDGMVQLYYYS